MYEFSTSTLVGVIDGKNTVFRTSNAMVPGTVGVFLNGLSLDPGLETGWYLQSDRLIKFREAPLVGDTVSVDYQLAAPDAAEQKFHLMPFVPDAPFIATLSPSMQLGALPIAAISTAQSLSPSLSVNTVPGPPLQTMPLKPELVP
ncbi:MAG: hypothetical protein ACRYGR_01655 [Janthinobacterium lividum]